MVEKQDVMHHLDEVEDPELELSIVELGLVYDVRFETKDAVMHAEIDLTLTSPGCPAAPEIMAATHRAALLTDGLDSVHINLVWSPRWDPKSTQLKTHGWTWVSGTDHRLTTIVSKSPSLRRWSKPTRCQSNFALGPLTLA